MTEIRTHPIPRDDRMWPRWAIPFSAVVVVAAIATFVVLVVTAPGTTKGLVVLAFVVVAAVETALYLVAIRRLLEGHPLPRWNNLAQLALAVAAFVVVGVDAQVGIAAFAGLFGAMFCANLWSIRAARGNRARVDEAEAELAREREDLARDERSQDVAPVREYAADDVPAVGPVLRYILAVAVRNWLAWLVAGLIVLMGCVLLHAPEAATFGVVFMGGCALLWLPRRMVGAWLAKRDFERAATEPRRAYVVLLHDPTPQMMRPLLGVWSEEPVVAEGRFPRPERVYRCDDEVDVLECYPGSVVVHEAWVDTGKRAGSKPRWVAADSGVALPHRRALLGRWSMSNHIRHERPEPAIPLTMPAPGPRSEAITEVNPDLGSFPVKVAWRSAGLAAMGLVFVLLT